MTTDKATTGEKAVTAADVGTLEWWTVREVANRYGYDPSSVRLWLSEGRIKGAKLPGGTWRIHVDVVHAIGAAGVPHRPPQRKETPPEYRDLPDYCGDDETPSPKARART